MFFKTLPAGKPGLVPHTYMSSPDASDSLDALSANRAFGYYCVLGLTIVSMTLDFETKPCARSCSLVV